MTMTKRKSLLYISDILESIQHIEQYAENLTFDDFAKDRKTIDAIVRNFEIIGEAVKNVPKSLKLEYPVIPWKKMAGMRDRIIHEYFGVDIEILWKTIKEDLPKVKPEIEKILESFGQKLL